MELISFMRLLKQAHSFMVTREAGSGCRNLTYGFRAADDNEILIRQEARLASED
jgi:hypothetical protein